MRPESAQRGAKARPAAARFRGRLAWSLGARLLVLSVCFGSDSAGSANASSTSSATGAAPNRQEPRVGGTNDSPASSGATSTATLEETRLTLGKWIETQQIISRERKEWQQGKEVLVGRLDLIRQEVATLEEKIAQAQSAVAEVDQKRAELVAQNEELETSAARMVEAVSAMEGEARRLQSVVPEPIQPRLRPLLQRMPEDPESTRVSVAERFQNVLGILNELNKTNNEITTSYEVHELSDGRPAEVKVIYVGLAHAYYVSANGDAGIGRPSEAGWRWEPSKALARDVLLALEIKEGKHSPAFVPLPVKLQ